MGGQQTKGRALGSKEPILLGNSLDLIYNDNFFDDPRYQHLLEKYLAKQETGPEKQGKNRKKRGKNPEKQWKGPGKHVDHDHHHHHHHHHHTVSDSALFDSKHKQNPQGKRLAHENRRRMKLAEKGWNASSSLEPPERSSLKASRSRSKGKTGNATQIRPGTKGKTGNATQNRPGSKGKTGSATPNHPGWNSSATANPSTASDNDKKLQRASLNVGLSHGSTPHSSRLIGDHALPSRLLSLSISHASKPIQKQRSAFTATQGQSMVPLVPNVVRQKSDDEILRNRNVDEDTPRPTSLGKDWAPRTSSMKDSPRPVTATLKQSAIPQYEKPKYAAKNKLVVRGLKSFVNSRRKSMDSETTTKSSSSSSSSTSYLSGRPKLWTREFPIKGKFHPDNYIYDFDEGPKAPPRPFSAMAKCKKHGGRCDNCGIFTCDLCQTCRKCEIDCACPRKLTTACPPYPYSCPMDVYSDVFGGDGWKKTCKVICDLTENEKMHPVGGNATKQAIRNTKRIDPAARNNMYQAQIDVLNPCNIPLNDDRNMCLPASPSIMMPPAFPMCAMPPMYSMPYMSAMMPPPMMPFYGPSQFYPPPCMPPPPPVPYPPTNSFMPPQNFSY